MRALTPSRGGTREQLDTQASVTLRFGDTERMFRHALAISIALSTTAIGCGDDAKGSSGVVSCDVEQAGLHYCEEYHGAAASDTGCPAMMDGFTPGSGCSRTGVAGTCSEGRYQIYVYGSGVEASAVAAACPSGTFSAGSAGDSSGAGGDGSVETTSGGAANEG